MSDIAQAIESVGWGYIYLRIINDITMFTFVSLVTILIAVGVRAVFKYETRQ